MAIRDRFAFKVNSAFNQLIGAQIMKKMLWLLMIAIALGGSGCQKNSQKSNNRFSSQAKKLKDGVPFDEELEELELIDEMDEAFFSGGEATTGAHEANIDDFAWTEVEKSERPEEILFNFDQYNIRSDQQKKITTASKWARISNRKGNKIVIEGHADAIGKNRIYNMSLSENRARKIAQEMIHQGVPKNYIKVVGRGQEMIKVISNINPTAQEPNRRVEFYEIRS